MKTFFAALLLFSAWGPFLAAQPCWKISNRRWSGTLS